MLEVIIVSVFACLFCSYSYFLEVFITKLWLEKKGYEN